MFRPVRSVPALAALVLTALCAPAAAAASQAPSIDPIPVQFGAEGAGFSLQVAGHDSDGDLLYYSAMGLPDGLIIDQMTGIICGRPAAPGDSTIVVMASDGRLSTAAEFTLHVAAAPTMVEALVTFAPQINVEGDRVDLDVQMLWTESRLDSPGRLDRPPVGVFSMENLPPGIRFTRKIGRIHGHIDQGAAKGTPYVVIVTMTEGSRVFTETFDWTVLNRR